MLYTHAFNPSGSNLLPKDKQRLVLELKGHCSHSQMGFSETKVDHCLLEAAPTSNVSQLLMLMLISKHLHHRQFHDASLFTRSLWSIASQRTRSVIWVHFWQELPHSDGDRVMQSQVLCNKTIVFERF